MQIWVNQLSLRWVLAIRRVVSHFVVVVVVCVLRFESVREIFKGERQGERQGKYKITTNNVVECALCPQLMNNSIRWICNTNANRLRAVAYRMKWKKLLLSCSLVRRRWKKKEKKKLQFIWYALERQSWSKVHYTEWVSIKRVVCTMNQTKAIFVLVFFFFFCFVLRSTGPCEDRENHDQIVIKISRTIRCDITMKPYLRSNTHPIRTISITQQTDTERSAEWQCLYTCTMYSILLYLTNHPLNS